MVNEYNEANNVLHVESSYQHILPETNEEIVVCRQRRLDDDIIYSREMVISKDKGLVRDMNYCTHLYSQEKITALLTSAGFDSITIPDSFVSNERKGDFGLMTNRMIVIAGKGT